MSDAPVLITGGRVVDPSRDLDATLDVLLAGGVAFLLPESILEGMKTPVTECDEELDW